MSIWFRIQHDDGDDYSIHAKLGKVEFKSIYTYTKDELSDAVKDLSGLNMAEDDD